MIGADEVGSSAEAFDVVRKNIRCMNTGEEVQKLLELVDYIEQQEDGWQYTGPDNLGSDRKFLEVAINHGTLMGFEHSRNPGRMTRSVSVDFRLNEEEIVQYIRGAKIPDPKSSQTTW